MVCFFCRASRLACAGGAPLRSVYGRRCLRPRRTSGSFRRVAAPGRAREFMQRQVPLPWPMRNSTSTGSPLRSAAAHLFVGGLEMIPLEGIARVQPRLSLSSCPGGTPFHREWRREPRHRARLCQVAWGLSLDGMRSCSSSVLTAQRMFIYAPAGGDVHGRDRCSHISPASSRHSAEEGQESALNSEVDVLGRTVEYLQVRGMASPARARSPR